MKNGREPHTVKPIFHSGVKSPVVSIITTPRMSNSRYGTLKFLMFSFMVAPIGSRVRAGPFGRLGQ